MDISTTDGLEALLAVAQGQAISSSRERDFSRALLESMSDGVVACDAQGMLTLFNRTARAWHGADPMQLPAAAWPTQYDLFHADGVTALAPEDVPLARAFRGERVVDAEMAIAAKGQPVRYIVANGSVIANDQGARLGAVVVMRDVTQLRRVEAELRRANQALEDRVRERAEQLDQQHATLEGIIESAPSPIFSVDQQYRYTSFNAGHAEAMRALYGVEVALGQSMIERMTVARDRVIAQRNLDRALAGEALTDEAVSGEDDATRRYFRVTHHPITDAEGAVTGVAVFAHDLTDRARAEEALRRSEQHYRAIFDNVLDGLYLIDVLDDGRFRTAEVNPGLERLTGISRALTVGKTQEEAVPPDVARVVNAKYQRCVDERQPIEEEVLLDLPVGQRSFRSTLIPDFGHDGAVRRIIGITRDVTESRRAEAERQAKLKLFEGLDRVNRALQVTDDVEAMMRAVLDIVLELLDCDRAYLLYPCDPDAATWTCPMERARPEYPGVGTLGLEVPTDALVAETFRALLDDEGPIRDGELVEALLSSEFAAELQAKALMAIAVRPRVGKPWQFGVHQCSRERAWTDDDARLLQEIGRRLADGLTSLLTNRDLRLSEAKYRQIIDTANEGVWVTGASGRIEFVNARTAELLGYAPEELVGRPTTEFIAPDELADHERRILNRQRGLSESYERRYRRSDGRVFWALVSATPVFDAEHAFAGSLAMLTDITERKQAEAELMALNRELSAISECNQTLVYADDEHKLIGDICRIICEKAGYAMAWVGYAEHDEAKTVRPVAWGGTGSDYIAGIRLSWSADDANGRGPAGTVIRSGQTLYVKDFATDPYMVPWREPLLQRGYRSGVALPLLDDEAHALGALLIYASEVDAISARELRLLEELARDLGFGLSVLRSRAQRAETQTKLALMRFALNNMRESSYLIDEGGRFLDVNDESCSALGYSRDELLGMAVADIDPDFPQSRWPGHWRMMKDVGSLVFDTNHRTKDGRVVPVEINATYFEYGGRDYNLALVRDISERTAAEAVLRDTSRLLSEAQRLAHVGSWDLDLTTDTLKWSDEIYRIFGLQPGQFSASYDAFLNAVHPEDRERVNAAYLASLKERVPYAIDHRLLMADGTVKYVHEQCETHYDGDRPVRSIGTVQDVTARTLAEAARHERESFIHDILDSVGEGIVVVDRQMRILAANRVYCELAGADERRIVGRKCYDVSHDLDRPCSGCGESCAVQRALGDGLAHETSHVHAARNGDKRHVEIRAYPVLDASGAVVSVIETVNDVTERVKLEAQLRQAQKMEAIGTLAGGIAHDFNNVLTAILGYGELVREDMAPTDPNVFAMEEILRASGRAAQLTRGLLAFSRKQIMNPKTLELNDVVRNVERLLRRVIGEDVVLSTTLSTHDLVVMADAGQLEQVLMNLATNARDAMPDGGALSITTSGVWLDEQAAMDVGFDSAGGFAKITVVDTGEGMDAETREKVFEPFFTTKELGKGTGLGLAIVYGIVKQHGGSVTLASELGVGTTFEVLLPLIDGAVEELEANERARPARGTETILYAEDDGAVRRLITGVLTGYGYHVLEAVDGQAALRTFADFGHSVDMLLLDVIMPHKSGREVYDAVRERRPDMPTLFVSGYTDDIIHKRGVFDEGIEFIAKPLNPFDLLARVRAILDASRAGGAEPKG